MLRALVERLSRGLVLRRRLPASLGGQRLYVSPDAALRFWRPGLAHADPVLLSLAHECVAPGATVWDIGANVGLFTFAAAFLAGTGGRVLAVEADDWLTSLLRRSQGTMPTHYARVDVLTAAVADRLGQADFVVARRGRAGSHLQAVNGSSQSGGGRSTCKVSTTTLDALLDTERAPSLIKVDVEGAEVLCLLGAERILRDVRPIWICEVGAANSEEVGKIMRRHRYVLFDGSVAAAERERLRVPAWTTIAVPEPA